MAGLVGAMGWPTSGGDLSKMVRNTEQTLVYTGDEQVYRWAGQDSCYCAISLIVPRSYASFSQNSFQEDATVSCLVEGEVLDYGEGSAIAGRLSGKYPPAIACFHAYREEGPKAFCALNGSFNLAFYDASSNELTLVNDRFASRPLFVCVSGNQLRFASQLRSVLAFPGVNGRLDMRALFEFFAFQRVLEDRTLCSEVKTLLPGTVLRFRGGRVSLERYWRMRYRPKDESAEYYAGALSEALQRAVRRRTSGHHRFGVLLSGGLDSRAVLAATAKDKVGTAFTLGDWPNREVRIAQEVAKAKGCSHIFIRRDPDHYVRLLEEAVDIGDGMYRFDHAHFLGALDIMTERCDAILHGHGLDYTFQGLYLPYKRLTLLGTQVGLPILSRLSLDDLENEILCACARPRIPESMASVFQPYLRRQLRESLMDSIRGVLQNKEAYGENPYNALDYFRLHCLSKHFTFLNFLCVRHYIPERTVIYDNDLFDLYLTMPPELRASGRVYRKALRRLSATLGFIPNANTGSRADMPVWEEYAVGGGRRCLRWLARSRASKRGHSVLTEGSWPDNSELIRQRKGMRQVIWDTIHDDGCIDPGIFDVSAVEAVFERHIDRYANCSDLLFLLLTFGRWFRKYGA